MKYCIRFGPDRIGNLVSMATNSSHMFIIGKNDVNTLAPSFWIEFSSYLQVTRISSRMGWKFGQTRPRTAELAAIGRLEKSP